MLGPKDKGKCKDTNKCDYKERLPIMERRKGLRKMTNNQIEDSDKI